MTDVVCPKCETTTDRIYELPYGSEEKGWMCEDCVLETCNTAHHWDWSDEDFRNAGVDKVQD